MGVFKLYFQIARWLSHQSTEILLSESLEQIAAQYTQYSYSVHLLHHKRNGTHVVVQMRKFDQD